MFGRSILGGCTLSTSFSRAYLLLVVQHTATAIRHSLARHVDDMEQIATGLNEKQVKSTSIRQAVILAREIRNKALATSSKSVFISNKSHIGKAIGRIVQAVGVPIKHERSGVHIGVETARLLEGIRSTKS